MMIALEPHIASDGTYEVSTGYLLSQLASERMRTRTELARAIVDKDARLLEEKVARYARCEEALVNSDIEYPKAPLRLPARVATNMDAFVSWAERRLYGKLAYR